jgi:hypothetical protein
MEDLDPNQLLDRGELAANLTRKGYKISKQTLAKRACLDMDGPEYHVAFGRALYRWGPALAWAEKQLGQARRSSFETAVAA